MAPVESTPIPPPSPGIPASAAGRETGVGSVGVALQPPTARTAAVKAATANRLLNIPEALIAFLLVTEEPQSLAEAPKRGLGTNPSQPTKFLLIHCASL